MSMSFTDMRLILPILFSALMAGCSSTLPVQPGTSASMPADATAPATTTPAQDGALQQQFATAVSAMKAAQYKEAIALFSLIAKHHPDLASPHINLGIIHFQQGNMNDAESAFRTAVQHNDKDHVAYTYLGMIYRTQGRFAESRTAYVQALTIKPDYATAHLDLAILCDLYLGDLNNAVLHYQAYQQNSATPDPRVEGWLKDLQNRIQTRGGAGKS